MKYARKFNTQTGNFCQDHQHKTTRTENEEKLEKRKSGAKSKIKI